MHVVDVAGPMPFNARDEGSNCVSLMWWAIYACPYSGAMHALCRAAAPEAGDLAGRPVTALASAAGLWPEGHAYCDNTMVGRCRLNRWNPC